MAKTQESSSETVEVILALEREIMDAIKHKDIGALGKIIADDFIHRSPGGVDARKEDFLTSVGSLPVEVLEIWGEELKVSVFEEIAILTGVQRVRAKSPDGNEDTGAGAFTDVFVRRGDEWLMVLAYSVELPVSNQSEGLSNL